MSGIKISEINITKSSGNINKIQIFKFLMDNIPEFVFFKDFDSKYVIVNKTASHVLDLKNPKDVSGKTDVDFFPDMAEQLRNDDQKVLDSGKPLKNKLQRLKFPDGKTRWIKSTKAPVKNERGDIFGIIGISKDVTKEIQIEAELRDSKEKFQNLFEKMTSCVAVYHAVDNGNDFILKDFNRAVEQIEQIKKDKVIGKKVTDVFPGVKKFGIFNMLQRVYKTGKAEYLPEYMYEDNSKSESWREGWVYKLSSDEIVAIYNDITESKKNEIKLEKIFNMSSELICEADIDTATFTKVNPAFTKVLGYTEKELCSRSFIDFIHPDDKKITQQVIDKQLQNGKKVLSFINRYQCKDGSFVWLDWNSNPVPEEGLIYAIARDITEKKTANDLLKKRERELSLTLDATTDGIWSWNFKTNELFFSPKYYTMLGYKPKEFKATYENWIDLIHPDDKEHALQVAENFLKTKPDFYENEFRMRTKDGRYKWIHTRAKVVERDKDNKAVLMIGHHEDITKEKKAQKALVKSENKYRSLVNNLNEGIWKIDKENITTFVNPRMAEMLGYSVNEMMGKSLFDFMDETSKKECLCNLKRRKQGIKEQHDFKFLHKNGKIIHTSMETTPIFENNHYVGALAGVQNISSRVKAENALKESEEKYRAVVDHIGVGVSIISPNLEIQFLNDQMKKWFPSINVKRKPICYQSFNTPSKKEPCDYCPTIKTLQDGKLHSTITNTPTRKGIVHFHIISTPIFNKNGDIEAVIELVEDVSDDHNAKKKIIESNKYLQNIIDSASELIITINNKGRIQSWNKSIQHITGFTNKEVYGKHFQDLELFENPESIMDMINQISGGEEPDFDRYTLKTKEFGKRIIHTSYSPIKNDKNEITGVLLIGEDVTDIEKIHGKLISGNSYLIDGETEKNSITIFENIISKEMKGLCITRSNVENIKRKLCTKHISICLLDKHPYKNYETISNIPSLISKIEQFTKDNPGSVIFLDRIDYLLNKFSFEILIDALYDINGLIIRTNSILLLRVNPMIFDQYHYSMITEEFQPLPSQNNDNIQLKEHLFSILDFVNNQNEKNVMVTYKLISKKFSIVNYTVSTRLKQLEEMGLIYIQKKGRSKAVYITDKGKKLLKKKEVL